ncbi:MAG: malate dehydrogenase [Candidatus Aenigmarchaeota archaeon]|nr:malate dehydrogenase [Candidatus Aenigmarchaeota archaeon]
MPKITIVGAGNVGAVTAHLLAMKKLGDVVLVDVLEGVAQGKALDIIEAGPIEGYGVSVIGTGSYEETKGSDIVIVTAAVPRKPGWTRKDFLDNNSKIVRNVVENIVKYSPGCILIIVSNPLDVMTYLACKTSGFSRERVIGMGCALDSSRFRHFIAQELHASNANVDAFVMGAHSDLMVPVVSHAYANGKPLTTLLDPGRVSTIVEKTRKAGPEIVALLKTGNAHYAPASAIAELVDAILSDSKKIIPCSVYVKGEYGTNGLCIGVPVHIGKKGAEAVVETTLTNEERNAFEKGVQETKEMIKLLEQ